ncbi:MAG: hypothetical protein H6584_02425 [Flavobacteriales bacterium]|nr:hypothetical protein [Flavobacteriales bacterium]
MNKLILCFSVFILLHGCTTIEDTKEEKQRQLNQLNTLCLHNQYYYEDGVVQNIGVQLQTKFVLLGYNEDDDQKIFELLYNTGLDLFTINMYEWSIDSKYTYAFIELKENKSCYEMEQVFNVLKANSLIQFTSYVYNNNFIKFDDDSYSDIVAYSHSFIVETQSDTDIEKLNKIVAETNTDIIDSKDGKYTISATKKSKGDALQMANYFHETGLFKSVKVGWNGISNILDL